jgi:hypothetical protein
MHIRSYYFDVEKALVNSYILRLKLTVTSCHSVQMRPPNKIN